MCLTHMFYPRGLNIFFASSEIDDNEFSDIIRIVVMKLNKC